MVCIRSSMKSVLICKYLIMDSQNPDALFEAIKCYEEENFGTPGLTNRPFRYLLIECYAAYIGSFLPTFRDTVYAPYSMVQRPLTLVVCTNILFRNVGKYLAVYAA